MYILDMYGVKICKCKDLQERKRERERVVGSSQVCQGNRVCPSAPRSPSGGTLAASPQGEGARPPPCLGRADVMVGSSTRAIHTPESHLESYHRIIPLKKYV